MFGYVYINKPELKIKDYEAYKGVYCSLCKTLGKNYGLFARFILNYDLTFLSLFIISQGSVCPGFKKGRCPFNPLKKCNYTVKAEDALNKGAALTVIASYYKLLDSIADGKGPKKLGAKLIKPIFSHWHKKAKAAYKEYEKIFREMFYSQLSAEKSPDVCLDMAAEPTAKMLSQVFKLEAKEKSEAKVFEGFGYNLGRWIYLMDAAKDLQEDFKTKNFNPFIVKYKTIENVDYNEVEAVINQSYYLLTRAYELIDKNRFEAILDNIIYSGLALKQKNTLYPERKS